jgi:hypothetical protein
VVATLSALVAVGASIGGQEVASRIGLRSLVVAAMVVSSAMAFAIGFTPAIPYTAVVALVLIYSVAVQADSAVLTIGAVGSAGAGRRGATTPSWGLAARRWVPSYSAQSSMQGAGWRTSAAGALPSRPWA